MIYGHAFNNHWLWFDDYTTINQSSSGSDTWMDLTDADGMDAAVMTKINSLIKEVKTTTPTKYDDPWLYAYKLVTGLDAVFPTNAYTVAIMNQLGSFYGRACVVKELGEYQFTTRSDSSTAFTKAAKIIILRMR